MTDLDFKAIGLKIKERRKQLGETQEHIANMLEVNPSHVSNIECGRANPSLTALVKIANILKCSVDYFISEEYTYKIDKEKEKQRKQLIYDLLSDTELELKAVLCDFEIGMSDLLSLQVDDVIPLDLKISDDIKVLVDDVPWFNAKLGQSNIKKAV